MFPRAMSKWLAPNEDPVDMRSVDSRRAARALDNEVVLYPGAAEIRTPDRTAAPVALTEVQIRIGRRPDHHQHEHRQRDSEQPPTVAPIRLCMQKISPTTPRPSGHPASQPIVLRDKPNGQRERTLHRRMPLPARSTPAPLAGREG